MESSIWKQFARFVKYCYQEKFSTAFKGSFLGLFGSLGLFWSGQGIPSILIYLLKGAGTIILTGGTTLMSCYVSYKFDKWKEKKSPNPTGKRKNNRAA